MRNTTYCPHQGKGSFLPQGEENEGKDTGAYSKATREKVVMGSLRLW